MRTLRVPYDLGAPDVIGALHRELQALRISNIRLVGGIALVDVEDGEQRSEVRSVSSLAGVRVVEVDHHAALLPEWLPLRASEQPLTLVHVDAHNDLLSPNVLRTPGGLADRWTGEVVDPADPASVAGAVDSVAVEIGSFLTLALLWLPVARMIWVCPGEVPGTIRGVDAPRGLRLEWARSDPLNRRLERLSVVPRVERVGPIAVEVLRTPEALGGAVAASPAGPIVLDVDLDYFDDSDEHASPDARPSGNDATKEAWFGAQEEQMHALWRALPAERIVEIGLARSPGFCPRARAERLAASVRQGLAGFLGACAGAEGAPT